jgi:lipoate-protein ligase B
VKQWVTLHGFALNVEPDLGWFEAIVPCGLQDVTMTSVRDEAAGEGPWWTPSRDAVVARLAASLGLEAVRREAPG